MRRSLEIENIKRVQVQGAVLGAIAGAVIGVAVSSDNDRAAGLIVGGVLGGATGYQLATIRTRDRQRALDVAVELTRELRETEVEVTRASRSLQFLTAQRRAQSEVGGADTRQVAMALALDIRAAARSAERLQASVLATKHFTRGIDHNDSEARFRSLLRQSVRTEASSLQYYEVIGESRTFYEELIVVAGCASDTEEPETEEESKGFSHIPLPSCN